MKPPSMYMSPPSSSYEIFRQGEIVFQGFECRLKKQKQKTCLLFIFHQYYIYSTGTIADWCNDEQVDKYATLTLKSFKLSFFFFLKNPSLAAKNTK